MYTVSGEQLCSYVFQSSLTAVTVRDIDHCTLIHKTSEVTLYIAGKLRYCLLGGSPLLHENSVPHSRPHLHAAAQLYTLVLLHSQQSSLNSLLTTHPRLADLPTNQPTNQKGNLRAESCASVRHHPL
jgi:hypothetical protein